MVFASFLDDIFDDCPMFFCITFSIHFVMFFGRLHFRFSSFFDFLLFRRHAFYPIKTMVLAHSTLSENLNSILKKHQQIKKILKFRTIFALKFHEFSWLFRHRFSPRFFHWLLIVFWWKMAPKRMPNRTNFNQNFKLFLRPIPGPHFVDFFVTWCQNARFWDPPWRPAGYQMATKIVQVAPKGRCTHLYALPLRSPFSWPTSKVRTRAILGTISLDLGWILASLFKLFLDF